MRQGGEVAAVEQAAVPVSTEEPGRSGGRAIAAVAGIALLALHRGEFLSIFRLSASALVVSIILATMIVLLPEAFGRALSFIVTRVALFGQIEIKFSGVRVVSWVEHADLMSSHHQKTPPRKQNKRASSFDKSALRWGRMRLTDLDDASSDSPESSDDEEAHAVEKGALLLPWADRARLCVEIRVRRFSFSNPKGGPWCRKRFVTASNIDVVMSASLRHVCRLAGLCRVWSWRPRHQPVRPLEDGGGLQFAAVKDATSKAWRNKTMLGVLIIEKFEIGDLEIAFEQNNGVLNVNEIARVLAVGEMARAGGRSGAPGPAVAVRRGRDFFDTLRVDVLAARHLDATRRSKAARPSTFAKVSLRSQERRSRTIARTTSPVYAYEAQPIAVNDPSAVVHICVYDEQILGRAALIGQFATTLKQLVLEPNAVDGGAGLLKRDSEDCCERYGWVPLRDSKWRPFNCPRYPEVDRACDRIDQYAFVDGTSLATVALPPSLLDDDSFRNHVVDTSPRDSEFMRLEPETGYPALLVRFKWEKTATYHSYRPETAMENIKINSAETGARCGCCDTVRAMLATFPFYLEVKSGFKIKGEAVAHCRDLFLGVHGELEKSRCARQDGVLTDSDWRRARQHAVKLSRIDVSFPARKRQRICYSGSEESVSYESGLLTLDGACARLLKGIVDHVLASPAKVSSSVAQIASACGMRALSLSLRHAGKRDNHVEPAAGMPLTAENAARPEGGGLFIRRARAANLGGTSRLALAFGLARATYKRFDARFIDDLNQPFAAVGVLCKLGRRVWKPYRCVLRGATLFYFEVDPTTRRRRKGEDRAIDLRRMVVDIDPRCPKGRDDKILCDLQDGTLTMSIRLDNGRPQDVKMRMPPAIEVNKAGPRVQIDAAAWDMDVFAAFESNPSVSLEMWRDRIVDAVLMERHKAELEVSAVVTAYGDNQLDIIERSDEDFKESESAESVYSSRASLPPAVSQKFNKIPINGAYQLQRRSYFIDALGFSEGMSVQSRVTCSAANAKLYINVIDNNRVFLFMNDSFMPFRFTGPLDRPVKTPFIADVPDSVIVMSTVALSADRRSLYLSQASPETGFIFSRTEFRITSRGDTLERRICWPQTKDLPRSSLLFNRGRDYDEFRRMSDDLAWKFELAVVS